MTQKERCRALIQFLLAERQESDVPLPTDEAGQKRLLRGLMNVRPPLPIGQDFLRLQDEYLQEELRRRGVTDWRTLPPVREGLCLWRGDITTLRCDAIVNAANSAMLGCFYPCHGCIDNAIHTFAGVQLRLELNGQMERQGYDEPVGQARLQPALPVCAAHRGALRRRQADGSASGGSGFLLPRLSGNRGPARTGKRGVLLHLYRGISFSPGRSRADRSSYRSGLSKSQFNQGDLRCVPRIRRTSLPKPAGIPSPG